MGSKLRAILQLKAHDLTDMSVSSGADAPVQMREAIEAEGQARLCELMARAALERQESRGGFFGGHYRLDYPALDNDNWLKNVILSNRGGDIHVSHEAPAEIDMPAHIRDVIATHWRPPNDPAHFAESE